MDSRITSLSEWMQPRAELLIAILRALQIEVSVYSTRRTLAEQKHLYAIGWTDTLKSRHLTGDAMDLILQPPFTYKLAGHIWTLLGGKWGGDFKPKSLADREYQHFQKP